MQKLSLPPFLSAFVAISHVYQQRNQAYEDPVPLRHMLAQEKINTPKTIITPHTNPNPNQSDNVGYTSAEELRSDAKEEEYENMENDTAMDEDYI